MEYLEEICKGFCAYENSLMLQINDFSARPLWQEVQAVVADAEVFFEYPQEIISDELYHYRMEGEHLYFRVQKDGENVNPLTLIRNE